MVERARQEAGGLVQEFRHRQERTVDAPHALEGLGLDLKADGGGDA
jgi:hypothetical protein